MCNFRGGLNHLDACTTEAGEEDLLLYKIVCSKPHFPVTMTPKLKHV